MAQKPVSREQAQSAVDAVNRFITVSAAARALNLARSTVDNQLRAARRMGIEPDPQRFVRAAEVKAASTLYGPDGEIKLQWLKTEAQTRNPEQWAEYLKDVFSGVDRVKRIELKKMTRRKDLMTVYPIGDHHVAMYAWAEETGDDYDIKVADKLLTSAMAHLVEQSEPCEQALIVNVGDFFHVDNLKNETARSGNSLDVDTRYAAMIRAGIKMLRVCIELALEKHANVKIINAIGNHDDIGSLWLSLALSLLYEKNPRVQIETSPSKFHYHQFGNVLIGVTHGDTGRPEKLAGVMAADRPDMWGTTKFRYWITGHVHHRTQVELPGVMWETFRTLAARDAWAHSRGYRAGRDMTCIRFHAEFGEVGRNTFNVAMLE